MKTMVALLVMSMTGCAATQEFFGLNPTECEARSKEVVARVEKATAQLCENQANWKAGAAIIETAVDTVAQ